MLLSGPEVSIPDAGTSLRTPQKETHLLTLALFAYLSLDVLSFPFVRGCLYMRGTRLHTESLNEVSVIARTWWLRPVSVTLPLNNMAIMGGLVMGV